MPIPFRDRRTDDVPPDIAAALSALSALSAQSARSGRPEVDGGRVLSAAPDADSRAWLVAGRFALTLVDPGRPEPVVWSRPWHEVDAGSWSRETSQLTVTWVDRSRPGQWRLGDGQRERTFLQTLRERVTASVVLTEELALSGRRTGRAVIRQDLRTGGFVEQVVLARGVQVDEEVSAASARALDWLREQVGMPRA